MISKKNDENIVNRYTWTEHMSNGEILRRVGVERGLLKTIRKRQMEFFGYVMRKIGMEPLAVTGKIEGNKGGGRPHEGFLTGLSTGANMMKGEMTKKQRTER